MLDFDKTWDYLSNHWYAYRQEEEFIWEEEEAICEEGEGVSEGEETVSEEREGVSEPLRLCGPREKEKGRHSLGRHHTPRPAAVGLTAGAACVGTCALCTVLTCSRDRFLVSVSLSLSPPPLSLCLPVFLDSSRLR